MQFSVEQRLQSIKESRRANGMMRGVSSILACATAVCTVCALMLPAFTLTNGVDAGSVSAELSMESSAAGSSTDSGQDANAANGEDSSASGNADADHSQTTELSSGDASAGQENSGSGQLPADNSETAAANNADGTGDYESNDAEASSTEADGAALAAETSLTANWTHPQGAITGTAQTDLIVFYNMDGSDSKLLPCAGVTYTVYKDAGDGTAGDVVGTYTSGDDYSVTIGTLATGNYLISQTAVPDGYIVYPQTKSFTVGTDGTASIGVFYDYKVEDFDMSKSAQVIDYENRTYQVEISAASGVYGYSIEPENYALVVDQSNSMLFPAELTETGKTVTLYKSGSSGWRTNSAQLNALGLDTSQVYYIVADAQNTSTVYAIWYDPNGNGWCYQDAAYYAKAQFYDNGITHNSKENDYYVAFAQVGDTYRSSSQAIDHDGRKVYGGAGIDTGLGGTLGTDFGSASSKSFTIYTGSTYNRLHDLQSAVSTFACLLGSLNKNNTMQIVTFAKEPGSCANVTLDESGVSRVLEMVNNITTTGGTRQDLAIQHLTSDNHLSSSKANKIILITDGAPSGSTVSAVTSSINYSKQSWPTNSTLITIGLSMKNVEGGSKMLEDVASSKNDGTKWAFDVEKAGQLSQILLTEILSNSDSVVKTNVSVHGNVVDTISNSFYPVDEKGNALTSGAWIALDGTLTSQSSADAAGQVVWDDDSKTWQVVWSSQEFGTESSETPPVWVGHVYLKAKEDFIGGNAIDTNASAQIQLLSESGGDSLGSAYELETPTVNVRLLDLNEHNSEITLFKGDIVNPAGKSGVPESPETALQELYAQTEFTKLVSGAGDTYNKAGMGEANGCNAATFTLAYAASQLSEEQWTQLINGQTVEVAYTYDDDSSHGAVGSFEFSLAKTGTDSSYDAHELTQVGDSVEAYTLSIVYKAYALGENDRPATNANNGQNGPGSEVDATSTASLPNGGGTIEKADTFTVNGVDGQITITKKLDDSMVKNSDQTFTFRLQRVGDSQPVEQAVTVLAGQNEASVTVGGLKRGTYVLTEATNQAFKAKEIGIVASDTTCQSSVNNGSSPKQATFAIGTDVSGNDVISYASLTSGNKTTYSALADGVSQEGFVVSKGHAQVTNEAIYYELPNTGGIGTFPYASGGLVAVVGAGLLLTYRFVKRERGRL